MLQDQEAVMGQILVDDIDDAVIAALRDRASRHARSLEAEARTILEEGAARPLAVTEMTHAEREAMWVELRRQADENRLASAGRHHTDSAILLREIRDES
jgi:plasmid stability protein